MFRNVYDVYKYNMPRLSLIFIIKQDLNENANISNKMHDLTKKEKTSFET